MQDWEGVSVCVRVQVGVCAHACILGVAFIPQVTRTQVITGRIAIEPPNRRIIWR